MVDVFIIVRIRYDYYEQFFYTDLLGMHSLSLCDW